MNQIGDRRMAIGKKSGKKAGKVLTPEEKLEQALAPVEEQPYPLPENWCWTRVGVLSELHRGVSYKKEDAHAEKQMDDVLIMRGGNIGEGYIDIETDNVYVHRSLVQKNQLIRENDIIVVASTGSTKVIGRAGVSKEDYSDVAFGAFLILIRPTRKSNPVYLDYYFQSEIYRNRIQTLASGVNINNIRADYITQAAIPFPPLTEQQRIVDCIESLFAKLDGAKEKVQVVLDSFETRKASILHKAFSGELTELWRRQHNIKLDSWKICTLESVCKTIFDGDHMPPPKAESGVPFLVISNVNTGYLSYENTRYVSQDYYASLSATRKPELGDVLYTLVGSYGIPVVVDDERPFCFQRHMALLKPKEVNTYFLWYLLQSQAMYNKATSIATGTAQLTVPIKGLRKIEFRKPGEEEQKEIVCILNSLFAKEKRVKETAEAILEQIEIMKKSILARAFRGELGTNEPSEESAQELLKNI